MNDSVVKCIGETTHRFLYTTSLHEVIAVVSKEMDHITKFS